MARNKMLLICMSTDEKKAITEYSKAINQPVSRFVRNLIVENLEERNKPELDLEYTGEFDSMIAVMLNDKTRNELKQFCEDTYKKQRYMASYVRAITLEQMANG